MSCRKTNCLLGTIKVKVKLSLTVTLRHVQEGRRRCTTCLSPVGPRQLTCLDEARVDFDLRSNFRKSRVPDSGSDSSQWGLEAGWDRNVIQVWLCLHLPPVEWLCSVHAQVQANRFRQQDRSFRGTCTYTYIYVLVANDITAGQRSTQWDGVH